MVGCIHSTQYCGRRDRLLSQARMTQQNAAYNVDHFAAYILVVTHTETEESAGMIERKRLGYSIVQHAAPEKMSNKVYLKSDPSRSTPAFFPRSEWQRDACSSIWYPIPNTWTTVSHYHGSIGPSDSVVFLHHLYSMFWLTFAPGGALPQPGGWPPPPWIPGGAWGCSSFPAPLCWVTTSCRFWRGWAKPQIGQTISS